MKRKTWIRVLGAVIGIGVVTLFLFSWTGTPIGRARVVSNLVDDNTEARGGDDAWAAIDSLRLTGHMEVGKGMKVPYVLEQKRPDKMCLEFVFDGETAIQCTNGNSGWKLVPHQGRTAPEPMSEKELRETADAGDPRGLLYDYGRRGHEVEYLGPEPVEGRDAVKLEVTLPGGATRWVYIDPESGLEAKVEALRVVGGRERRVETFYSDWQTTDGVLIAHRQETQTEGDDHRYVLTVETVTVNPPLDDQRFAMPKGAEATAARAN